MFSGKKILVLGGSGGIGRKIVSCLKNYGGIVNAPGHSELDLAVPESTERYFHSHPADYDVFVYAAGINTPVAFELMTLEMLSEILQVNTLGFFPLVH